MPPPTLRVISRHQPAPPVTVPLRRTHPRVRRWLWLLAVAGATVAAGVLIWWLSTAVDREIQALPDDQRIPLYQRTIRNLKDVCDPAAPRSLRDFCHKEADLVLRFRECSADPACQELARRHMPHPYR